MTAELNGLTPNMTKHLQTVAQQALTSQDIPKIFANGFVSGMGFGDTYLILQTNGQSTAVINLTYPVLKTLSQNLNTLVDQLETQLGEPLPTLAELQSKITAVS